MTWAPVAWVRAALVILHLGGPLHLMLESHHPRGRPEHVPMRSNHLATVMPGPGSSPGTGKTSGNGSTGHALIALDAHNARQGKVGHATSEGADHLT